MKYLFLFLLLFASLQTIGQVIVIKPKTQPEPQPRQEPKSEPKVVKKRTVPVRQQPSNPGPAQTYTYNLEPVFNNAYEAFSNENYNSSIETLLKVPNEYQNFRVLELLALNYKKLNNYSNARNTSLKIISNGLTQNSEEIGNTYFEIADCLHNEFQAGNKTDGKLLKEAFQAIEKANQFNPKQAEILLLKAKLSDLTSNWEKSIEAYNEVETLLTENEKKELYLNRGIAYSKVRGKHFESFKDFQNAKKLGENSNLVNEEIENNAYYISTIGIEKYNASTSIKEYDDTYEILKKAYLKGEDTFAPFYIGELYFHNMITLSKALENNESFSIAFNYFEEDISKTEGGNPTSYFHIGYMYEKGKGTAKDIEKAKKFYQIACDKGRTESCEALKKIR